MGGDVSLTLNERRLLVKLEAKRYRSARSFRLQIFNYCATDRDSAKVDYVLLVIQITPLQSQRFTDSDAGYSYQKDQRSIWLFQLSHDLESLFGTYENSSIVCF